MTKVYHVINPNFGFGDKEHTFPDEYVLVATVDSEDLEKVFELTNSIDSPWWENKGVHPKFTGQGCRSTSVGDVVSMEDGTALRCENFGWEPL